MNVLAKLLEEGVMIAAPNCNPGFTVELPAIATGARANAAVLLDLLKKGWRAAPGERAPRARGAGAWTSSCR